MAKDGWSRFAWLNGLYEADLNAVAKSVGAYLFARADDAGCAWPAIDTIAERIGRSRSAVKAALRELERYGWIETRQRKGTSSSYSLTPGQNVTRSECDPPPGQNVTGGGENVSGGWSHSDPKQTNEQTKNKPQRHSGARVREESVEEVMLRVEEETGRTLTDAEAKRVLELGEPLAAVDAFVDMAKKYRNATPYQICQYARDRLTREAEKPPPPRNALRRDDNYSRELLDEMLANSVDEQGRPIGREDS